MTSAPSNVPSGSPAAPRQKFSKSFSPQSPPQQPHEPMSLREVHAGTTRTSKHHKDHCRSEMSKSTNTRVASFEWDGDSSRIRSKTSKELQEVTLHDPFASLAINAGLATQEGPENPAPKSASLSPPMSSSGERTVSGGTPRSHRDQRYKVSDEPFR